MNGWLVLLVVILGVIAVYIVLGFIFKKRPEHHIDEVDEAHPENNRRTQQWRTPTSGFSINCDACGGELNPWSQFCPWCGTQILEDSKRNPPTKEDDLVRLSEMRILAERNHGDAKTESICPVCQTGFLKGKPTVTCSACSVKHHKECWEMVGGCSTFGCNLGPGRFRRQ